MGAAGYAYNPRSCTAFKMQQQIADTVRAFVRAPPHVLITQDLQTALNLRKIISAQEAARLGDKVFSYVSHHLWTSSLLPVGNSVQALSRPAKPCRLARGDRISPGPARQ